MIFGNFPARLNLVVDSTGQNVFAPDSLPQVLAYDVDGNLETVTVGPDDKGNTYVQTMTYTGGKLTGISAWVKQ